MARLKYQFLYSAQPMLTYIEGNFVVLGTGAVGTIKGAGITSITRLSPGTYQVVLSQVYPRYLAGAAGFVSPATTSVAAGSFVVGDSYVINALGTTNFNAAGLNIGLVAAPGIPFVATTVGAGTGSAFLVTNSGISHVEVIGNTNLTITQPGLPSLIMQCLNSAGAATDPTAGSVLGFDMFVKNSTAKAGNE